jgi:hypothetical protein
MKNTKIDVAMRKAFQLGEAYRVAMKGHDIAAADIAWADFEAYITTTMLDENGDTNMIDEENERRKRFGRMR